MLGRLGLVSKITLVTVLLILLTALGVGGAAIWEIRGDVAETVIQRQNASLRTAAMLLRKAHPDTQFTIAAGGTVTRLVMKTIDRKSVVSGKSVSVRVDLGGRRIIKKKLRHRIITTKQ